MLDSLMKPNPSTPWYIAIGASGAQGLNDIRTLLSQLPVSLNAVILVVLHRPWDKISYLKEILSRVSLMPVVIAGDGECFERGVVYIGEPADHLTLAQKSFGAIVEDPERQYGNRTVDLLFKSVAQFGGKRIIGVILSGSLDDGSRGLAEIHRAGGLSMVLMPTADALPGMQENAIAFDGPIDTIGDSLHISNAIIKVVGATDCILGGTRLPVR
jgi:two-component system chemotaxis response regulator CheB